MTREDRIERALDAALESTFPASDPIPFYGYEPRPSPEGTRDEASD